MFPFINNVATATNNLSPKQIGHKENFITSSIRNKLTLVLVFVVVSTTLIIKEIKTTRDDIKSLMPTRDMLDKNPNKFIEIPITGNEANLFASENDLIERKEEDGVSVYIKVPKGATSLLILENGVGQRIQINGEEEILVGYDSKSGIKVVFEGIPSSNILVQTTPEEEPQEEKGEEPSRKENPENNELFVDRPKKNLGEIA